MTVQDIPKEDIVATYHFGSAVCHVANTALKVSPGEMGARKERVGQVSWEIVLHMRRLRVDV